MRALSVSASEFLRSFEKAKPTLEKRRSTVAEVAGQPRYCRAITSRFGNCWRCSSHQSIASFSLLYLICGSARYSFSSSLTGAAASSSPSSSSSESAKKDAAETLGLFGIYAHGMTETWAMVKALIGLVACESKRHTAENLKK